MKKIFHGLLSIVLCTVMFCYGAPLSAGRTKVFSQGVTNVTAAFGKTRISIKITTHEVDIGKLSDKWPQKRLSSCTYSRVPCSPIDYVEISVNSNALLVPRSVYADLADVAEASVRQNKKGQFALILGGGDASESYTVEIIFGENLVSQRIFMDNESGQVMEKNIYYASQTMD
jgi:hypothetical protein